MISVVDARTGFMAPTFLANPWPWHVPGAVVTDFNGHQVELDDGSGYTILDVDAGLFSAVVTFRSDLGASYRLKLPIRWFHPAGNGHLRTILIPS
jgi:hypothetical protein